MSGPLTVESVRVRSKQVRRDFAEHRNTDALVARNRLFVDVLLAIADGHPRSADLAKAALKLRTHA